MYLRDKPECISNDARKVVLIGQDDDKEDVEEWIIFSRSVFNETKSAGHVEIAFALDPGANDSQDPSVRRVEDFPLVVFFPTILPTNLGFVIQGPYRTTPSRDNVPRDDPWNRHLVEETAALLVDALVGLRELGLLDVGAIQCLPFEASRFPESNRFTLLFRAVRDALMGKPLLPAYGGGHVAAQKAKLARTQALRDLIGSEQLTGLFPSDDKLVWVSDDITLNQTPILHSYLTQELDIDEVTPDSLIRRLNVAFLKTQSDEWIERLYEFLNGQRGIFNRPWGPNPPLLRLEDGSHVTFDDKKSPNAYLPGDIQTGFPTVMRSVCQSKEAQDFLKYLGLRVPAVVDDVIANVLPKYRKDSVNIPDSEYRTDIERVLAAFDTDSNAQRNQLLTVLKEAKFVAAVDTGSGASQFVRPGEPYLATDRLKNLFEGVPGVRIVDHSKDCLRGESIRRLLRATGTPEYLLPTEVRPSLTYAEKQELRLSKGSGAITYEVSVTDYTLVGLNSLLTLLSNLPIVQATCRGKSIWDALRDVQAQRGDSIFEGNYRWMRYETREARFPANFVKVLKQTAWVPSESGTLQTPGAVVFQDTGWDRNPSLEDKIGFKPDVLNILAEKAGIEPGVLDLLMAHGLTTEAQVRELLGETSEDAKSASVDLTSDETATDNGRELSRRSTPRQSDATQRLENTDDADNQTSTGTRTRSSDTTNRDQKQADTDDGKVPSNTRNRTRERTDGGARDVARSNPARRQKFVSYVSVSPNEADEDPDGLQHQERMSLEDRAIDLIVSREPALQRTRPNNPGFDLIERGPDGTPIRFIEVKAMRSTLNHRPVTLTRTQFQFAQERQNAYWIYVVENAGDSEQSRIVRIKNPAGKAQTFTFDHGWVEVSEDPQ